MITTEKNNQKQKIRQENRPTVIQLSNISKTFYIREKGNNSIRDKAFNFFSDNNKRKIEALKNVNIDIKKGEFFGVLGRNGSGKSTLLKIITGAIPPDKGGTMKTNGKIIRLALGMGFDPNLSARENIYVNASIIGLTFRQIGVKFHEIVAFAELEKFVDTPVRYFSTGMRSRLAFAIAVHAEADIFLMDEFFGGVGDIAFRRKSAQIFRESFVKGRTIIHVSHNLKTIEEHCNRVLLLDRGDVVALGEPKEILAIYRKLFHQKK